MAFLAPLAAPLTGALTSAGMGATTAGVLGAAGTGAALGGITGGLISEATGGKFSDGLKKGAVLGGLAMGTPAAFGAGGTGAGAATTAGEVGATFASPAPVFVAETGISAGVPQFVPMGTGLTGGLTYAAPAAAATPTGLAAYLPTGQELVKGGITSALMTGAGAALTPPPPPQPMGFGGVGQMGDEPMFGGSPEQMMQMLAMFGNDVTF